MSPFFEFVEGVVDDKLVVGKYIKLAVERFLNDYDKKDYVFDIKEGQRIVDFAQNFCHHWKGPKMGKPVVLEPHQHFYWMQKYGWKNPNTGLPRFRRSVKLIARKQYKTTEVAMESLFHMAKGIDQPAQVFTCATKEDDAVIVVNDAGRIAMVSPKLKPVFKVSIHEPYVRRVFMNNGSFMTYMTKGHDAVDISMGVGDECHDWPDASIKNRIESAMGNRIAPTFSNISTAGFDKFKYCYTTLRDTSIKILEGIMTDDDLLILIFEMDEGDDWKNKEMWVKANPNLPYSPTHMPYLESEFKKALNEGGTTEVNFKTKNLNMWVDAPEVWIQKETWDLNAHEIDENDLIGRDCFGGLDLVSGDELNALVLLFPNVRDNIAAVKLICWRPEKLEIHRDFVPFVETCPGNVIDNDFIFHKIHEEISKYNVRSIATYNAKVNHDIVQAIVRSGVTINTITQSYQGLSTPSLEWQNLLKAEKIEHFKNPLLSWMNSNCQILRKGNDIMVQKAGGRTSGIVAAINALAEWKTDEANGIKVETEFTPL